MVKTKTDYLNQLSEMYPDIDRTILDGIVSEGLGTMQDLMRRDHDLRLEQLHSRFDQYRLIFFKSKKTEEEKKKRYFTNLYRLQKYRDKKRSEYEAKKLRTK